MKAPEFSKDIFYAGEKMILVSVYDERKHKNWDYECILYNPYTTCYVHKGDFHGLYVSAECKSAKPYGESILSPLFSTFLTSKK